MDIVKSGQERDLFCSVTDLIPSPSQNRVFKVHITKVSLALFFSDTHTQMHAHTLSLLSAGNHSSGEKQLSGLTAVYLRKYSFNTASFLQICLNIS